MKLAETDIRTREVLSWTGLHLFHAQASSCSQKLRIFLNLKRIPWTSHPIDLAAGENISAYYLGINPRGLVPALVHDGEVHIESNDILLYLEDKFPLPTLVPPGSRDAIGDLLRHEDDLHLMLRTVSFRFLMSPDEPPRSSGDLARYASLGSGTIGGVEDPALHREIGFWQSLIDRGIPDPDVREAVAAFRDAFADLDRQLARRPFIMGAMLTVVDIAWMVYVHRLELAGYPLPRLHPHLAAWADRLRVDPAFAPELALPPPLAERVTARRALLDRSGASLEAVCRL